MGRYSATFYIYEAEDGWRWQLKARNGNIIADSGEAYTTEQNCRKGIMAVKRALFVPVKIVR